MSVNEIFLLIAFIISGAITHRMLTKHNMHVAKTIYSVAFIIIFTYFPILAGKSILYSMLTASCPASKSYLYDGMIAPSVRMAPVISVSVLVVIAISLFFSISLIVSAWYAAKMIYTLIIKKTSRNYEIKTRRSINPSFFKPFLIPASEYRYIFCKYNC